MGVSWGVGGLSCETIVNSYDVYKKLYDVCMNLYELFTCVARKLFENFHFVQTWPEIGPQSTPEAVDEAIRVNKNTPEPILRSKRPVVRPGGRF